MTGFTEVQVEEIVREAVEKTEKSFGGTFKRLKSENEELKYKFEAAVSDYDSVKKDMEKKSVNYHQNSRKVKNTSPNSP